LPNSPKTIWPPEHITEEQRLHYLAVGILSERWNILERFFSWLASDIQGAFDRRDHDMLFRHLGDLSLVAFIKEYAKTHISDEAIVAQVDLVCCHYDVCRINRNLIVHSTRESGSTITETILFRTPDKNRPLRALVTLDLAAIQRVADEIENAAYLILWLGQAIYSHYLPDSGVSRYHRDDPEARARWLPRSPVPKILAKPPQTNSKPPSQQLK
jgi:hypothetical protein